MTPADWTLMVIAEAPQATQPVQLQKALFVLGQKLNAAQLGVERFYTFAPYDYGPFCATVYEDAEQLEREGLISISQPPDTRFKLYKITPLGQARAAELKAALGARERDYLHRLIQFIQRLNFNELVSSIYKAFPEMSANSVFRGPK